MHQPNAHSYSGRAAAKPCEPSHTLRGLHPVDHRKGDIRGDYHYEGRQYNQSTVELN